ncbi:hypothetical protein T12_6187 [Trichinella patagoniensis]|uniref:Uncharacterized protein n=1 Tax=Trichinella patagoniensis TaxID=990121 RepID=A0A0V0Z3U1_9BILA|nr:hypothetical protein T12_6187 [Trichinella patagoniensis]
MFNQCCHHAHGSLLKQLHCTHTAEIFTISKKILTQLRYIENQTPQKIRNSPEAEESVDAAKASSWYPAIVDMLYWKWRFFKIPDLHKSNLIVNSTEHNGYAVKLAVADPAEILLQNECQTAKGRLYSGSHYSDSNSISSPEFSFILLRTVTITHLHGMLEGAIQTHQPQREYQTEQAKKIFICLRFKYCSSKRQVTIFSARQTKYLFARNVSSFMNMVIWPLSEIIAFPIASHEMQKGILVQRENEEMTNCPQLQVSKKILPEFRYIKNRTLQKTGKSPEAEESVDEVEASSLYTAIVDMLYWKWRFFKIAFFPHCMPGAHLHYSSLRDLPDKFELSFCRSVHGT